jgi:hypothetical protein
MSLKPRMTLEFREWHIHRNSRVHQGSHNDIHEFFASFFCKEKIAKLSFAQLHVLETLE